MLFLGLHGDRVNLANIFWGLWRFPFGVLVIRSGFLPRILGVLPIVNGVALVVVSFTGLLLPTYLNVVTGLRSSQSLGNGGLWRGFCAPKCIRRSATRRLTPQLSNGSNATVERISGKAGSEVVALVAIQIAAQAAPSVRVRTAHDACQHGSYGAPFADLYLRE
jgi:hypothetical protein